MIVKERDISPASPFIEVEPFANLHQIAEDVTSQFILAEKVKTVSPLGVTELTTSSSGNSGSTTTSFSFSEQDTAANKIATSKNSLVNVYVVFILFKI